MEYEEKVFEVVRNFMEYKEYQGNKETAIKAIIKKFPGTSTTECNALFTASCKAYENAVLLVKNNLPYYSAKDRQEVLEEEIQFRKQHAEVTPQILSWIIGWIYHWYHER